MSSLWAILSTSIRLCNALKYFDSNTCSQKKCEQYFKSEVHFWPPFAILLGSTRLGNALKCFDSSKCLQKITWAMLCVRVTPLTTVCNSFSAQQTVIWVSNNSYISLGTTVSHDVADYSNAMYFLLLFYWKKKTVPFPKRELNTMQSMWIFSISDCPLVPPSSSVLLKWSCLGVSWNLICPA